MIPYLFINIFLISALISPTLSFLINRYHRFKFETKRFSNNDIIILQDGKEKIVSIPNDISILDALLDLGIEAPHSCKQGLCTECACKVTQGKLFIINITTFQQDIFNHIIIYI